MQAIDIVFCNDIFYDICQSLSYFWQCRVIYLNLLMIYHPTWRYRTMQSRISCCSTSTCCDTIRSDPSMEFYSTCMRFIQHKSKDIISWIRASCACKLSTPWLIRLVIKSRTNPANPYKDSIKLQFLQAIHRVCRLFFLSSYGPRSRPVYARYCSDPCSARFLVWKHVR